MCEFSSIFMFAWTEFKYKMEEKNTWDLVVKHRIKHWIVFNNWMEYRIILPYQVRHIIEPSKFECDRDYGNKIILSSIW